MSSKFWAVYKADYESPTPMGFYSSQAEAEAAAAYLNTQTTTRLYLHDDHFGVVEYELDTYFPHRHRSLTWNIRLRLDENDPSIVRDAHCEVVGSDSPDSDENWHVYLWRYESSSEWRANGNVTATSEAEALKAGLAIARQMISEEAA